MLLIFFIFFSEISLTALLAWLISRPHFCIGVIHTRVSSYTFIDSALSSDWTFKKLNGLCSSTADGRQEAVMEEVTAVAHTTMTGSLRRSFVRDIWRSCEFRPRMRGYDDEMTAIMTQGSLYVARKLCIIIIIILIIKDNVYGAVIMTYSHCESSPGSSWRM